MNRPNTYKLTDLNAQMCQISEIVYSFLNLFSNWFTSVEEMVKIQHISTLSYNCREYETLPEQVPNTICRYRPYPSAIWELEQADL